MNGDFDLRPKSRIPKSPKTIEQTDFVDVSHHEHQDHGPLVDVICVHTRPLPKPAPDVGQTDMRQRDMPQ